MCNQYTRCFLEEKDMTDTIQRCITSVGPTVAALTGAPFAGETDTPHAALTALAAGKAGGTVDRAVLYNPDAVALWLYEKYPDIFRPAGERSDIALPMTSVMPSVTPVCFGSMYTGVQPCVHGIMKYEKPVLRQETLFDAFLRAGKRCAIVSTEGDSISKIFLERQMDYFICKTVSAVNRKALALVKQGGYDLITVYNGNYDSRMHAKGPESAYALRALKANIDFYVRLTETVRRAYAGQRVLYGFCPDHGCHLIDGNRGSHGLDMEEDMNVIHFYGIL